MKKVLSIFFVILCLNTHIFAQADYRQGFVIMNNNDTVFGLIDYNGDISNSNYCRFKQNKDDKPIEYKPFDIKCYRFIEDKFYISKEISLNGAKEKKFLEFLLHGIVDLYSYQSSDGLIFYIQKGDTLIELKNREFKTFIDGIEYYKKDKKYIGILKSLFADAPEIQNKIEHLDLNRKSLISISENYHDQVCKDHKCVIYKKKLPPVNISIGPLIGTHKLFIDPQVLSWKIYRNQTILDCHYDISIHPIYGLFAYTLLPYSNGRLALQYEGLISSYKLNSTYQNIGTGLDGPNIDGTYKYSINSTDLTHYFSLRYNIFKLKFRPFIQIGGYISQKLKLDKTGSTYLSPELSPDFSKSDLMYYGFGAGLGLAYQYKENKEVFVKVIFNKGLGSLSYFSTKEINLTLGIPIVNFKF